MGRGTIVPLSMTDLPNPQSRAALAARFGPNYR